MVILTHAREKVAQIFNLPYRRFAIGKTFKGRQRRGFPVLEKSAKFLAVNGFSFASNFGRTKS
jgi:hypothetical protein